MFTAAKILPAESEAILGQERYIDTLKVPHLSYAIMAHCYILACLCYVSNRFMTPKYFFEAATIQLLCLEAPEVTC